MGTKSTGNPADWSRLEDTYWYVRDEWLPAMQLDVSDNALSWVVDQTVWHVTGYRDGYFWGALGVQIYPAGEDVPRRGSGSRPMSMTLFGSVTPEGSVQMAFTSPRDSSGPPTVGYGRIVERDGQPSFEMQMFSGTGTVTGHWAHMLETRPGDPTWESLPGVGVSVPEFLEGFEAPADPAAPVGSDGER